MVLQLVQLVACILASAIVLAKQTPALPMVDPGLFVISGVSTCGKGSGYCLLGSDCSLDQDFMEDINGHCKGLKGAFTPSANFVCCKDSRQQNEIEPDTRGPYDRNNTMENLIDSKEELQANSTMEENTLITTTTDLPEQTTNLDAVAEEEMNSTETYEQDSTVEDETSYKPQPVESKRCSKNNCTTSIRFYHGNSQICLGTLIENGWVLTSASCALRVFRVGMVNVLAAVIEQPEFEAAVKTIIVNENYRPSVSNILLPEANNVGLIRLNETFPEVCNLCIPDKSDVFAGEICNTIVNTTVSSITKNGPIDVITCESEVETMQGEAKEEFLTIFCESQTFSRYLGGEIDSGKALICRGYLAGVETSSGVGMTVFTKISSYNEWIKENLKPNTRQSFRRTDK